MSSLLAGLFGCSAKSSGEAAVDTRVNPEDAGARTISAEAFSYKPSKAKLVIPSGTVLTVLLLDAISTDTSSAGDRFLASISDPVLVNGTTVLQKGTKVRGRVVDVQDSGRVERPASIRLELTEIMQGDKMIAIATERFFAEADSTHARDAQIISGGAGVGAVVGAMARGDKRAGISTIASGGAGADVVLANKGKEIHYGPETRLKFSLARSIEM